jgi:N-acetylglucosamine-6-sulfatase
MNCLIYLAILLLVACTASSPQAMDETNRPNIIFILTDDQEAGTMAYMPVLQRTLVDEGVHFTNAFVTTSTCCPSRTTILRGQYMHNHQVIGNQAPRGGYEKFQAQNLENSTIATWLDDAGYRTGLFGKYLNGYQPPQTMEIPKGWDEWFVWGREETEEIDFLNPDQGYVNYLINHNGTIENYGNTEKDYLTDVLSEKVVGFIQTSAEQGQTFFAMVNVYAPHAPAAPAPRHRDMFSNLQAPRHPNFNYVENYRNQLRTLQSVDDMIGAIVQALEETDTLENTYIIFMSDNGYHLGSHGDLRGKASYYEADIRVPLVMRGPGIPPGQVIDAMVLNNDIASTLATFANIPIPSFLDGYSLTHLWEEPAPTNWRSRFYVNLEFKNQIALRTTEYLYAKNIRNNRAELYNLVDDPYQLDNIYETADAALIEELDAQLQQLMACGGANCLEAEGFER